MIEGDLREKIKRTAAEHFNRDGYHGTTIRHIAGEVNCSLPMVYYYFKNKQDLFHEIIKKDYFELLRKQSESLKWTSALDFYTAFVFGINHLSDYEKKVYRLGIKVYLGFDGDDELSKLMDEWEKSILPRHHELVLPHLKNAENGAVVVRTLMHLLENLIESIVVKNRFLSEQEIRDELSVVLAGAV